MFNFKNEIYVTDMDKSFNLPGGRVENNEPIKQTLKRELKEELGIKVLNKEMVYIGNFTFWHKNFPGEKGKVNRENNVDLFLISEPKEIISNRVKLTKYEKHYHFNLFNIDINDIDNLINEKSDNEYKKFTNVELKTLIDAYLEYRKKD